jgi:hypothetical protein
MKEVMPSDILLDSDRVDYPEPSDDVRDFFLRLDKAIEDPTCGIVVTSFVRSANATPTH